MDHASLETVTVDEVAKSIEMRTRPFLKGGGGLCVDCLNLETQSHSYRVSCISWTELRSL